MAGRDLDSLEFGQAFNCGKKDVNRVFIKAGRRMARDRSTRNPCIGLLRKKLLS
jgi:hypothetical protein